MLFYNLFYNVILKGKKNDLKFVNIIIKFPYIAGFIFRDLFSISRLLFISCV